MTERQLAMVMDLNKCMGCHTCSVACKTLWTKREGMEGQYWNNVSTSPGAGTPANWEQMGGGFRDEVPVKGHLPSHEEHGEAWEFNYQEAFYGGRKNTKLAPVGKLRINGPNWDEDLGGGEFPDAWYFYLPRICNHCDKPACEAACPRQAIHKREQDGIVLVDEERCRGYRFCNEACPYKKIYFNRAEGVSQKCIFCLPRLEQGVPTACARQCPGRVRFLGYLDDPDSPTEKLVNQYKVALPLHPEYGTGPNVYYVPPLSPPKIDRQGRTTGGPRIPLEFLESLFGPEVGTALETLQREIEKKRNGQPSEVMDILIAFKHVDMFGPFSKSPRDVRPMDMIGVEV